MNLDSPHPARGASNLYALNPINERCRRPGAFSSLILFTWSMTYYFGLQLFFFSFWLFGKRSQQFSQLCSRYYSSIYCGLALYFSSNLDFHKKTFRLPQRYILVVNHLSAMDIIYTGFVSPRSLHFSKAENRFLPLFMFQGFLNGYLFEKNSKLTGKNTNTKQMIKALRAGYSLTIFAEGRINRENGEVAEFKNGAFIAAYKTHTPVVTASICDIPIPNGKNQVFFEYLGILKPSDFESAEELKGAARLSIQAAVAQRHHEFWFKQKSHATSIPLEMPLPAMDPA